MKRTDFIQTLKRASPALSSKDLVPSFSCFFFKDGKVMAYDDVVAIQTTVDDVSVEGGLQGKLLMDFLGASRAAEISIEVNDDVAELKASRGRLKLPVLPMDDFMFEWPEEKGHAIEVGDSFMNAIKACYASIGLDPSVPWRMGITLQFESGALAMYSSDNYSITECSVKLKVPKKLREVITILPPKFCELLISMGTPKELCLTEDWVTARYEDDTVLFSKTLHDVKPEGFTTVTASIEWDEGFVPVPKGFEGCLTRALVVLGGAEEQHSDFIVKDNKLRMFTKGNVGEARDYTKFKGHSNCTARARPALIRRALSHAESMSIREGQCIAFTGEGFRHLVAVTQE